MSNILITGAAGYIGGSVLTELLSRKNGSLAGVNLFAVARSQDQVDIISKLNGVSVHQLDLLDEKNAEEFIKKHEIDLVVYTAGATDQRMPANMLKALGKRREAGAENLSFVHTSVAPAYAAENGWPFGEIRDDDSVIDKEKQIGDQHPVRKTNIFIADQGKAIGVKTYNIAVPNTYGKGSGPVKQVSVSVPAYVRNSLKNKVVYKFDQEATPWATHINDLKALYALLVENIVQRNPIPSDDKGTYFGLAHRMSWWKIQEGMAKNLYDRGLVNDPKPHIWPSYEQAADELGFPRAFVRAMTISSGEQVPVNAYKLGWKPEWTEKMMVERLDEDIQACLDVDTGKFSLFQDLTNKP